MTVSLLVVTALFFGIEHMLGGGMDILAHIRLGALRQDRIAEHGEYFRLLMPLFLHNGLIHLVLNGFALLQLGALVEYFWGSRRLLTYYVVSGLGASLASAVFNTNIAGSVGASGAILGLAGLILGTSWYGSSPVREQLLELVGRQLLYGVLLTFGLGFGLWLILPVIDNWAHIGGFVTGLLLAGATPDPTKENLRLSMSASSASVAALICAIVWMGFEGGTAMDTAYLDLARGRAAMISEDRVFSPGVHIAQMTRLFLEADALEEGEETLARAIGRIHEGETVGIVAQSLMVLSEDDELPMDGALRITAERWHTLDRDNPQAMNLFAWQLLQGPEAERDPRRAVVLSRESLQRSGEAGPRTRSAYLDTLAEGLYQLGAYEDARVAQEEAVELARGIEPSMFEWVGLSPSLPVDDMAERLERIERAASGKGSGSG